MNIKKIAVGALMLGAVMQPLAAQKISDMAQAVLQCYSDLLAENPKDYATLLDRATAYYNLGMFKEAIADLDKAVEYTPAKQTDVLNKEWSLYADACIETKDYAKALECIDKALAANPMSYSDIYKKGNILMSLGQYEDAYRSYSRMQQFKSRSQEAYYGMAKASIAMGKGSDARALIKEAENAAPNSSVTYCRVGDLYVDLGEPTGAAASYLNAFLLAQDDEMARPLQSLGQLSKTNFPAVAETIDFAISKTSNTAPLLYLKASLAGESGNPQIAYDAYTELLKNPGAKDASIYTAQARSALMAGKTAEASQAVKNALAMERTSDALLVQAYIDLVDKRPADALAAAKSAATVDMSVTPLIVQALANIDLQKYDDAILPLNEAVMVFADNAEPLLIRGWLYKNRLGKEQNASADFNRVMRGEGTDFRAVFYKALAQAWNGDTAAADKAVHDALIADATKRNLEYAVAYYTQTGNLHALSELRKSAGSLADFNGSNPEFIWLSTLMK